MAGGHCRSMLSPQEPAQGSFAGIKSPFGVQYGGLVTRLIGVRSCVGAPLAFAQSTGGYVQNPDGHFCSRT